MYVIGASVILTVDNNICNSINHYICLYLLDHFIYVTQNQSFLDRHRNSTKEDINAFFRRWESFRVGSGIQSVYKSQQLYLARCVRKSEQHYSDETAQTSCVKGRCVIHNTGNTCNTAATDERYNLQLSSHTNFREFFCHNHLTFDSRYNHKRIRSLSSLLDPEQICSSSSRFFIEENWCTSINF